MIKFTQDEKSLLINLRGTPTFKLLQKITDEKIKVYGIMALKARDIVKVAEYDGAVQAYNSLIDLIDNAKEKKDDEPVQG